METSIILDSLLALFAVVFMARLAFESFDISLADSSPFAGKFGGSHKKSLLNQRVARRMTA